MSKNKLLLPKDKPVKALPPVFEPLNLDIQRAILSIPDSEHYFIALSGGLDSMALLGFVLPYLRSKNKSVQALHVHHGLSQNADAWALHCQNVCRELGVICHVEHVLVKPEGKGLEAAARKARYEVFDSFLSHCMTGEGRDGSRSGAVLLQGHHLNDQAETIMMRLLRGAGPEGLSGIPQQRRLSAGILFRPWLNIPKEVLKTEFEKTGLNWVEDESNTDLQFDRNYIRHQVLPLIQQRWPSSLYDLKRVSERAQETQSFLNSWCQQQENQLLSDVYTKERALNISALQGYSDIEQRLLARYWFDLLNIPHPSEKVFKRLWAEVIVATKDAQPEIRWGACRIRRFDGCLFLLSQSDVNNEPYEYSLDLSSHELPVSFQLPFGNIEINDVAKNMRQSALESENTYLIKKPENGKSVVLRSRSGGETIHLPGSMHATALKKVYQTRKVLPWLRPGLPLLYYGADLVFSGAGIIASDFEFKSYGDSLQVRIIKNGH